MGEDSCEGTFASLTYDVANAQGIPHPTQPFPYHDPLMVHLDQPQERLLKQMQKWIANPTLNPLPCKVVRLRSLILHFRSLRSLHSGD